MNRQSAIVDSSSAREAQSQTWDAFRRWGYLQANLDPLGDLEPVATARTRRFRPGRRSGAASLLRHDRRGIHAHSRSRAAPVDSGTHGIGSAPSRTARAFSNCWCAPKFSSRFCRRAIWAPSAFRSKAKRRCFRCCDAILSAAAERRRRASHHGHEPSRPAERDGPHRRARSLRKFSRDLRTSIRAASSAAAT